MNVPRVWNDLNEWKLKFTLQDPHIFFLWDHILLFNDLGADWAAGEPTALAEFVPTKYMFNFTFSKFKLFCNVNEQNIINKPNDLEENGIFILLFRFLFI
jgi:hypothetical protein